MAEYQKMITKSITIQCEEGGKATIIYFSHEDGWRIEGKLYPRYIKVIDYLSDFLKSEWKENK